MRSAPCGAHALEAEGALAGRAVQAHRLQKRPCTKEASAPPGWKRRRAGERPRKGNAHPNSKPLLVWGVGSEAARARARRRPPCPRSQPPRSNPERLNHQPTGCARLPGVCSVAVGHSQSGRAFPHPCLLSVRRVALRNRGSPRARTCLGNSRLGRRRDDETRTFPQCPQLSVVALLRPGPCPLSWRRSSTSTVHPTDLTTDPLPPALVARTRAQAPGGGLEGERDRANGACVSQRRVFIYLAKLLCPQRLTSQTRRSRRSAPPSRRSRSIGR